MQLQMKEFQPQGQEETERPMVLPVGAEEGWSTKGDVDSEVKTVAAITSLSAWPEGFLENTQTLEMWE